MRKLRSLALLPIFRLYNVNQRLAMMNTSIQNQYDNTLARLSYQPFSPRLCYGKLKNLRIWNHHRSLERCEDQFSFPSNWGVLSTQDSLVISVDSVKDRLIPFLYRDSPSSSYELSFRHFARQRCRTNKTASWGEI